MKLSFYMHVFMQLKVLYKGGCNLYQYAFLNLSLLALLVIPLQSFLKESDDNNYIIIISSIFVINYLLIIDKYYTVSLPLQDIVIYSSFSAKDRAKILYKTSMFHFLLYGIPLSLCNTVLFKILTSCTDIKIIFIVLLMTSWILSFLGLLSYLISLRHSLRIGIIGIVTIPLYIPLSIILLNLPFDDIFENLGKCMIVISSMIIYSYTILFFSLRCSKYSME